MERLNRTQSLDAADCSTTLRAAIGQAMVGQSAVIEQVLVALVASGHVLIEGVPGLGQDAAGARAGAGAVAGACPRAVHARHDAVRHHRPRGARSGDAASCAIVRGPVFTHVLLADEINRAPAKTQSALLEVMQEYQVTLEGQTLPLPKPFMVLATQNPVETEGTYPLPEAQLDRFLFKIEIGYPSSRRGSRPSSSARPTDQAGDELPLADVKPCLDGDAVLQLQQLAARQRVDEQVDRLRRAHRARDARLAGPGRRRGLARRAGARARRARRGAARRARLRDARRHQAHRAAGAAPPHGAGAGRAARRAHDQRSADARSIETVRRAARARCARTCRRCAGVMPRPYRARTAGRPATRRASWRSPCARLSGLTQSALAALSSAHRAPDGAR